MRDLNGWLAGLALAGLAAGGLSAAGLSPVGAAQAAPKQPGMHRAMAQGGRLTVSGEGSVSAEPDMARVTLGVTSEGDTARAALTANSADLTKVMQVLTKAGIDKRDIQTSGLSLGPRWSQQKTGEDAPPRIVGFTAANQVTVRVRALGDLGQVLDAVVSNGANTFSGVQFDLANDRPARDQARQEAVADAMAKARLYAKAAGVHLGRVISIDEGGSAPAPMPRMRMMAKAADSVPVAGGEIDVDANVTMVFAIRPEGPRGGGRGEGAGHDKPWTNGPKHGVGDTPRPKDGASGQP